VKIDPLALKGALRLIGTILVALRALPQLGPWAELCSTVGVALIAWAQNGPGAVQSTNFEAILTAAQKVVPPGHELVLKPSTPPPAGRTVVVESTR
jgi:hypothetical protein